MSEAYSETADTETARRLLEFGDDYRNFFDSQSDCASSSLGAVPYVSIDHYQKLLKILKIIAKISFTKWTLNLFSVCQ